MPTHSRFRNAAAIGLALSSLALLPGCIAVVAGAAGGAGGYTAAQERGLGDQIGDSAIRADISKSWHKYSDEMAEDLDITVYEGRVLLTGRVPNPDWRDEAGKRAWQVSGVKQVYNEIETGPVSGTIEDLSDTKITTQLRSNILLDRDIRSLNYTITTSDHVVYLIGLARSQTELNRVTDYARNIADVKRVVSYVQIREGAPTGQPEPTAQQPAEAPPVSAPTAAPVTGTVTTPSAPAASRSGGAIEVRPLQ